MSWKYISKFLNYRNIIIMILLVLLSGCGITDGFGLFADKPEPPPPIYTVDLNLSASNKLNLDLEGRASPVVTRIYQLKNDETFKSSDFFAIYNNDEVLLGKDITYRKEIELKPNDEVTTSTKLKQETQYLGIFAAFRDLDKAVWQLVVELKPEQTTSLNINLDTFTISRKQGDGGNEKIDKAVGKKENLLKIREEKTSDKDTLEAGGGGSKGTDVAKEESSLLDFLLEYIGFALNLGQSSLNSSDNFK
jgi:type VI secretion system protein VasD